MEPGAGGCQACGISVINVTEWQISVDRTPRWSGSMPRTTAVSPQWPARAGRFRIVTLAAGPRLTGYLRLTPIRRRGTLKGRSGKCHVQSRCVSRARFCLAFCFSPVRAASFLEKNFWLSGPRYDRDIPSCEYAPALDRIIGRFGTKEGRFWNSELRIVGIEDIQETAVLPWAAQSIPRRFCHATALINDGRRHQIY